MELNAEDLAEIEQDKARKIDEQVWHRLGVGGAEAGGKETVTWLGVASAGGGVERHAGSDRGVCCDG